MHVRVDVVRILVFEDEVVCQWRSTCEAQCDTDSSDERFNIGFVGEVAIKSIQLA